MSKDLQLQYKDVPFSQLYAKSIEDMSEDELRAFTAVVQQRTHVPGAKRSAKTKISKLEAGTITKVSLSAFQDEE